MRREDSLRVGIVGAGPVGISAALFLENSGISVTVLEAGTGLSAQSRASTFHPPTLEMLDQAGVTDDLLAAGLIAQKVQWRDRRAGVVCEFDYSLLEGETKFPYRLQLEQSKLTQIIYERLVAHPLVEFRFDSKVDSVDGLAELLDARYVIGADGSHSSVRRSMGIEFEGTRYPDLYLVALTSFDFQTVFKDLAYVNYVSDPEEWVSIFRTPGHWRATFPIDSRIAEKDIQPEVQDRLRKLVTGVDSFPIEHAFVYQVHQRVASTFRHDRYLLAGDAAHVNNPMGGLGMNSGIHDAYFLTKQLTRILRDGQRDSLLDDYSNVRRRVVTEYVNEDANRNWLLLREPDEEKRQSELARLRGIAEDPKKAKEYVMRASMLESVSATSAELSG